MATLTRLLRLQQTLDQRKPAHPAAHDIEMRIPSPRAACRASPRPATDRNLRRPWPVAAIGLPIARVPKTRRTHVNELRIDGVESLPGKAPAWQHLGTEVFHQRIAHADETLDDLQSFWTPGVENDGELSIVQSIEVRRSVEFGRPVAAANSSRCVLNWDRGRPSSCPAFEPPWAHRSRRSEPRCSGDRPSLRRSRHG